MHPAPPTRAARPVAARVAALAAARVAARVAALVACAALAACRTPRPPAAPAAARPAAPTAVDAARLRAALEARIAALRATVPGALVAVAVRDLAPGGVTLAIAGDSIVHAASTMKLAVLVALMQAADRGEVTLDRMVPVVNDFRSVADGSPYRLDPADDSDADAYALVGRQATVGELARRMMVRSSNLATNLLVPLLGADRITAAVTALGTTRTVVARGVEDGPAYRRGINNVTTATDLATLLAAVEQGRAASPEGTAAMRAILRAQEFRDAIPAGLPAGTVVGHKTGEITGVLHDAAIVYPPGRAPYVLVVLTRDVPEREAARRTVADVARLVHAALVGG